MSLLVLATLALAVLGALLGTGVAKLAARRSVTQPVTVELDSERKVLATILQEPGMYPAFAELRPEMFAARAHQRIWEAIQSEATTGGEPLEAPDQSALREMAPSVPTTLATDVLARLDEEDRVLASSLLDGDDVVGETRRVLVDAEPGKPVQKAFDALLGAGEVVHLAYQDRENFKGTAPIRETGEVERPLERVHVAPGRGRSLFTAALCAVGLGAVPFIVLERTPIEDPTAQLLAGTAIALMLLSSVVVALVDWDTLYLDLKTFWGSAALIWGLTVVAQVVDGAPSRLLHGLWAILLMLLLVEGLLKLYAKLRGLPMQGGGDTQILLVTAGVPAALSASVLVGLFGGVVASAVVALVVYGGLYLVGRFQKDTPFAYGPFLALGWLLGWIVAPMILAGPYA